MKNLKIVISAVIILFTACNNNGIYNIGYELLVDSEKYLRTKNRKNNIDDNSRTETIFEPFVTSEEVDPFATIISSCGFAEQNDFIDFSILEQYCDPIDNQITFVTTQKIHESMPEFTFTRIIGDYLDYHISYEPDSIAREMTIVIEDDKGNIIQVIPGLSQARLFINSDITFDDFNFDGYLDMRLMRWQEGAAALRAIEYFWLWNTEKLQFVPNEQLTKIGHAAGLNVNHDTQQIIVRQRNGTLSNLYFYEYICGSFELVAHEYTSQGYGEDGGYSYLIFTYTDLRTSEVTILTHPLP